MSIDLATQIGTLKLKSPVIVGSCPMTLDEMQRIAMVSNGVGAIVLPSIHVDGEPSIGEYLTQLEYISERDSVPVIASVRAGIQNEDWFNLPAKLQKAGAGAIELSVIGCNSTVGDPRKFEDNFVKFVEKAASSLEIPLFLKLTQSFTSLGDMARRLHPFVHCLVMFGRSPVVDIELDRLAVSSRWGLTQAGSIVNSLEPIMRTKMAFPEMPVIACGGIGSSEDLIKAIMAGADAVMVTSALYRHGIATLGTLKDGMTRFMSDHNVGSISALQKLCPTLDESGSVDQVNFSVTSEPKETCRKPTSGSAIQCDRFGHPV